MISKNTRQYWISVVLGWAKDRLAPPQYEECAQALTQWPARELQVAIGTAHWNWSFTQFCSCLGLREDDYAKDLK
jgi:hypothetical protein